MEVIGRKGQMICKEHKITFVKSKGNQLHMKKEHCKLIFQWLDDFLIGIKKIQNQLHRDNYKTSFNHN